MPARWSFLTYLACFLVAIIGPATAETIAGSDDADFVAAVETWLSGGDIEALSELSRLSNDGNTASQILLASIAKRGHMHTHVTQSLSRKERISLLRVPKGLSGKSWFTVAQDVEPLAVALQQSTRINEKGPAVAALFELGEPTEAMLAAQSMLFQGQAEELTNVLQGLDGLLPDEAAILLHWAVNGQNLPYTGSARVGSRLVGDPSFHSIGLAWVGPNPRDFSNEPELRDFTRKHARQVQSWTPIVAFCDARCGQDVEGCVATGAAALVLAGPFATRSPLENLIPNATYWASARMEGDLARLTPDVSIWDGSGFRETNACYFDAMAASQSLHGHAE